MLLIWGVKRLAIKKVAYAKDSCNACEEEVIVEKWKWFSFLSFFWIPLIPIGFFHRWSCTSCGKNANARYKTSIWIRVVLAILAGGLTGILFEPTSTEGISYGWLLQGGGAIMLFLALLMWIFKPTLGKSKKERRLFVTPVNSYQCVYCEGVLDLGVPPRCLKCKVEARQL
jgi:hypothetical protein